MNAETKEQSTKAEEEPAQIHQMAVDVGTPRKGRKWKHFYDFHGGSCKATTAHPLSPLRSSFHT